MRRWSGVAAYLDDWPWRFAIFEMDHTGNGWSFRVAFYVGPLHYEWHRRRDLGTGVLLKWERAA